MVDLRTRGGGVAGRDDLRAAAGRGAEGVELFKVVSAGSGAEVELFGGRQGLLDHLCPVAGPAQPRDATLGQRKAALCWEQGCAAPVASLLHEFDSSEPRLAG